MSRKKRILIIVENLPVPFDTRVWQESTTLVQNGYSVCVICPKGKGYEKSFETIEGVHIYRHSLPEEASGFKGYVKEYGTALKEQLRIATHIYNKHGFDIIHGCNPPDDIYMVARKFKKYGVGYVFDHHDICPELFEAKFAGRGFLYEKVLYKSQLWLEKQTYKNADFAFVTNESYKKIAIERGGMDPDKVLVLRSGPRLERLKIQPPKPELKNGRTFMVGYLGVIGRQEGIQYLLEAAGILIKKRSRRDVCFGIVGGGTSLEEMKALSNNMGLSEYVTFTGRVSDEIMLDYLNTADICVNPDEYNSMNDKSTMNKVLEYMALGKPIVQFDLTEGRYSAGEASLYARKNDPEDMANKIEELLDDPEKRRIMGEFGRNRIVNELSWEHTSKALLEGYERYFNGEFR